MGKRLTGAVAPLLLLGLSAISASAQTTQNLDPLFQGVLTRPTDINNTLQYALSASESGDIESAISAYEQLLFYDPRQSQTRFQLGVLYFQLGSYDMARGYLQSALEMPDLTPELRQKIEELLPLAEKKLQRDQFSGFAQAGVRYQSNASQGPGPQTTLASGQSFNNRFFAKSDWNGFGTFGLDYVHDFESPRGETFEASLLGYDAQQFTLHQFDLGLLELRAGPRFVLVPGNVGGITFKPYVVATGVTLADAAYMGGIGGGLTLHANIRNVSFDPYVEVVQQSFRNSTLYPLATGLNGTLSTYALQAYGPIVSGLTWQARVAYARDSDQAAFDSYNSYLADIWLPWNFSVWGGSRPWTFVPTAGISRWNYGAPDPTIDPLNTARTTEWRVGLGLDIPIWQALVFGSLVQYRSDQSNVAAFSMHDLSVTAGPSIKF